MIVSVAIKTKKGKIYVSRKSHSELLVMYPEEFREAEQGFLTSDCRFADREEALKIAKERKQIIKKHGLDNELYSEDIFLEDSISKQVIREKKEENEELKNKYNRVIKFIDKQIRCYVKKIAEIINIKEVQKRALKEKERRSLKYLTGKKDECIKIKNKMQELLGE